MFFQKKKKRAVLNSLEKKVKEKGYLAKRVRARDTASNFDGAALNTTDGHGGVDETSDTDTGNETGRDGVHETLVGPGASALPDLARGPSNQHGDGDSRRGIDETETNGVQVDPVGLEMFGDELDADNDVDDGQDAEDDGEVHGGCGNGAITGQDPANVSPGNDGGGAELAILDCLVEDARVGLGIQQEKGNSDANGEERTYQLGPQHGTGRSTDQISGLEISDHIDGLGADRGSNVGAHEVGFLNDCFISVGDTREDKLSDLGNGACRVDISLAGGLETDKGEEEGEDDGTDGSIDGNVEVKVHDQDGEDPGDDKTTSPPAGGDELMLGGQVLRDVVSLVDKGLLLGELTDKIATFMDSGQDGGGERLVVGTELGEGSENHHTDTGPEEPGLSRSNGRCDRDETNATGQVTSVSHEGTCNTKGDQLSEKEREDGASGGH